MKLARTTFLALLAVLALGSVAVSSAFATSPTALVLAGEPLPVEVNSVTDNPNNKILTELQNAAGTLKGEGLLLEVTITGASSGTYKVLFLKVTKGAESCSTPPDAAGEVLLPTNTFTFVHDESSTTGGGVLFNVSEFTVECGAAKIKIKGNVLGLVKPIGGGEKTAFEGALHCSKTVVGEPAETKFWNAAGTEETPLLLANFGTGFKKACEEIVPATIALTANKMIELMN